MLGLGAIPPLALLLWVTILMPESHVWIEEQACVASFPRLPNPIQHNQGKDHTAATQFSWRALLSPNQEHVRKLLLGASIPIHAENWQLIINGRFVLQWQRS